MEVPVRVAVLSFAHFAFEADGEQRRRVTAKAVGAARLGRFRPESVEELLAEVDRRYARTMNKIAFDIFLSQGGDDRLRTDLQLPPQAPLQSVPW